MYCILKILVSILGYSKKVTLITNIEKGLENSYTETVSDTSVTFIMILRFNSKLSYWFGVFLIHIQ